MNTGQHLNDSTQRFLAHQTLQRKTSYTTQRNDATTTSQADIFFSEVNSHQTLTDAGVEAGLRFQDVTGGKVDDVTGEAELAADGGFWLQQGNGFGLGSAAGSCGEG